MSDERLKEILGITEDNTLDFSPKEEDVEPSKDLSQLHEILTIDKITSVDDQPIEDEPKTSDVKGRNFFKDAWAGVKTGVMHGLSGLAKAPSLIAGTIYDAAAVPQNLISEYFNLPGLHATYEENIADSPLNPFSYTDKSAEYWREIALKQAPDIDLDIVSSIGNGDIVAAVYKLGVGVAQTSPQILALIGASMMGAPQAGLGAIGATAAGSKYQDLEEREDLSTDLRRTTAILNGTLEIMTEKLGSSKLIEDIINNPAGRQGLKQGFAKIIAKFVGTEAGEEFINSLAQDAVDKVLGVDPELTGAQMWKNAFNSGFIGLGMGTGLAGLKLVSQRSSKPKISEAIVDKFDYKESKVPEIQNQMNIVVDLCDQYDVDASIMAGLMKVESDFSNVESDYSTARGPLMVTDTAIADLERVGVKLHNSVDTLEGRLEAGVRYFKMLRDHYGFEGDELIAAYFAGPTYVRMNGITNEIVEGQISTSEYVSRWKEAHSTLLGINVDPSESTAELGDTRVEEAIVDQPLETFETASVGLNDPAIIKKSLETIGYTVGDRGDALLSAIAQFKDDFGLDWATDNDTGNLDDSILSQEFKETLKQALADKGETELLDQIAAMETQVNVIKDVAETQVKDEAQNIVTAKIGVPRADPGDYWQHYDNWLKEVSQQQKEVATIEMAQEIEAEQRDSLKADNLVKWYLNGMATSVAEAADLELFNKPSRGDAINTTRVLAEPKVLKSLELLGRAVEQGDRTSYQEIQKSFTNQFGSIDENVNEMVDKLGLLKESAERLKSELSRAPELVYGLREAVTSNGNALKTLATEITSKSGDVSDLTRAKFIKLLQLQKSLTGTLKGIWRKVGQTMSQGNMFVSGKSFNILDMTEAHLKYTTEGDLTLQQFIKDAGGPGKIAKIAEDIANPDNELADISDKARKSLGDKVIKTLVEYRSSNLLRHQATLKRNIMSQFLNMAAEWAANFSAATINLFKIGKRSDPLTLEAANRDYNMTYTEATKRFIGDLVGMVESFTKPIVSLQEAGETLYGQQHSKFNLLTMVVFQPAKFEKIFEASLIDSRINVEQGADHRRVSGDFMFRNTSPESTLAQLLRGPINYLGAILRLSSFGGLQVTDKPFSYGGYSSELVGQLHLLGQTVEVKNMSSKERKAYLRTVKDACIAIRKIKTLDAPISQKAFDKSLAENITVEDARKAIEGELTEGALEGLTEDMLKTAVAIDEAAMKQSKHMTWKEPFDSPGLGKTIERVLHQHSGLRIIIPFIHTPLKILQKGWRWTPLSREMRRNLKGHNGKRMQTQAFGQLAVTTSLIYWGFSLMASGMLTPPARNEKERERMNLAGTPPNSIKIGDKWVDYSQWIPFPGFFLSTASSAFREVYEAQYEEGKTTSERIIEAAGGTIQAIYQSVKNQTMLESIDRLQGALEGGYTDSYFKDFGKTLLPHYTFSRNITNYSYGGINPFYQEYLRTDDGIVKRDLFGKPIFNYKTFMGSRVETESESPIRQELSKLNLNLPKIRDSFNGIKLEPEQYQDLLRHFDERLRAEDRMNQLVLSSRYRRASEDNKIRMLRNVWEDLKYEAKMSLYKDQAYIEEYLAIQRAEQQKTQMNIPYTQKYIPGKPTGKSLWDILKQGE